MGYKMGILARNGTIYENKYNVVTLLVQTFNV